MKSRDEYYLYIKESISIKELCDKFGIQTMQIGNDYTCSCIYHSDPHPSMHIYTESGSFYCFECNKGGDIFTFLKQRLNCDFNGCIEWLEKEYPYLLEKKPVWNRERDIAYHKSGYQIAYEKYKAMSSEEEKQFQAFAKSRVYSTDFLSERGIFFAKGRKLHSSYAVSPDDYIEEVEKLKECQLLKTLPREKGWKDVLRYEDFCRNDRVIITLRNENGIIKGFAARSVGDDKPKYLFSRYLKKAEMLYRLDEVKKHLKDGSEEQRIYITEGFFDALRLETKNCLAVAVLGSTLANKQIKLLEETVGERNVSLRLFLDADEAGQKGTVSCISKIWRNKILRRCYLDVVVLKGKYEEEYKDPDAIWREQENAEIEIYSGFEFLMRYYMKEANQALSKINIAESFQSMNVEERISFLHKLEGILPKQEWRELFAYYDGIMENGLEQSDKSARNMAYFMIRHFVLGGSVNDFVKKNVLSNIQPEEEKNYHYRMQTALQIARTSYDREEVCLDQGTWDRIAVGADAYFEYLCAGLRNNEKIAIPLFSMLIPKKIGVQRKKALYCHEELLIQQYVLNELLESSQNINYEKNIPAVRYRRGAGTYLTGYQYRDISDEPRSFAYQVDMGAVNGTTVIKNGMFRPFYDCWRDYIGYIQDGIERLESETVYRVKLDIERFYDSISKFVVRNALYESVEEALHYDEKRFSFLSNEEENNDLAEKVVSWILDELFKKEYYNPRTGELERKEDDNQGIPQGPNLSAYVANVSLFPVDQRVAEVVRQANEDCEDGKIRARYARYVDDMIIIASTPELLLKIKGVIAAQLYDFGLNLSPKTEAEDGISKEEAYDWTTEERGGFGVSAGFDMADDSYESLMEDYEDYEVTDRRAALRLLQSNLYTLLYEGIEEDEDISSQFVNVFFQTEDIRYNDIVRFSEMLIYYAAKETKMLDRYKDLWEEGLRHSTDDALFGEEGLDMLILLSGCIRILRRQRNGRNIDSREKWKFVEEKICKEGEEICDSVKSAVSEGNILGKNRWALGLKVIEFRGLAQLPVESTVGNEIIKNEYGYRWVWDALEKSSEIMHFKPDQRYSKQNLLQNFSYCTETFIKMQKEEEYKEITSQFQKYLSQYDKGADNVFFNCIRIWFFNASDLDNRDCQIALRVLLNTVPESARAAIINGIDGLKGYVFSQKGNSEFLPVYPGVGYPGIMRVVKTGKKKISQIDRIDFKTQEENILDESGWQETAQTESEQYKVYEKKLNTAGYYHLKDFCRIKDKMSAAECMELVCQVYFPLKEEIRNENKNAKEQCPDRSFILSSKNVLIKEQDKRILIDTKNAYLVSTASMPNAVAIESGVDGRYIFKNVYEDGKEYWISGYLLRDACNIDEVLLRDGCNPERKRDAEMLDFSMRRLCGSSFEKYRSVVGKKRSYEASIERAIGLMKEYLGSSASEKELCLENAKIINSFIKVKMERNTNEQLDKNLEYAIWAKNYLRFGFRKLVAQMEQKGIMESADCPIKRRVPKWYCMLADRLNLMMQDDENFSGLKVLAAGLYADGVLMHLRMQVLECIFSFDREQRKSFLKTADELPLEELGLSEDDLLISTGDIVSVYKDLLDGNRYNRDMKKITHLGWLVLLAKVYEVDKQEGFIVFDSKQKIDRNALQINLKSVVSHIRMEEQKDQNKQPEFPFEDMAEFFLVWKKDNVNEILASLCNLDMAYGTRVEEKRSEDYRQRLNVKKVKIETKWNEYEEQPYFLTYGKLNKNVNDIECSIENEKLFVYTQTVIRDNVVGFSTIERDFGKLLQSWETQGAFPTKQDINGAKEDEKDETKKIEKAGREENDEAVAGRITPKEERDSHKLNAETSTIDEDEQGCIRKFQRTAWSKRGENKPFRNADRIALFQFRIDSSYKHPKAEECRYKEYQEEISENGGMFLSCAEYRRRNLLAPVMRTCALFNVDILLLPEYSLRPETVSWMKNLIEKNNYCFSVWAGTFRVPAGYQFDEKDIILDEKVDMAMFWHSAPLPVITRNEEGIPEIVLQKFKKYPSVALKEDINPFPAYAWYDTFRPVMDRYLSDLKGRLKEKGYIVKNDMFGDARDDVIELICAELFAVASVSNYPSFLQESLKAYANYSQLDIKEKDVYDQYREKYLKDLRSFGDYTAIYQHEEMADQHGNRSIRRPILLVPACTTRAVDYYVFGQGFYLSAGLKTVFCNAVGTGGRGGSCFIGPDSWDNNKVNEDPFLKEKTIYHGLKPGIYRQSSGEQCRGALGNEEQALLICDVYPHLDKGSPNAESMMSAFSLVAHIPVFEDRNYREECKGKCNRRQYCHLISQQTIKNCLDEIEKYCKEYKEGESGAIVHRLSYNDFVSQRNKAVKAMKILGECYHSDWFVKRAEAYEKYRLIYPQAWPPPTMTDWLYVETNYKGFRDSNAPGELEECRIQIPMYMELNKKAEISEEKEIKNA